MAVLVFLNLGSNGALLSAAMAATLGLGNVFSILFIVDRLNFLEEVGRDS